MKARVARSVLLLAVNALVLVSAPMILKAGHGSADANSMEVGGLTRNYLLRVPSSYQSGTPVPLVLVLHGATQSPENVERMSKMSELADEKGFIAAYPRGTGDIPTWNAGNCCGPALRNRVDDVGFIRALIEKIEGEYKIDPKRIYVTGISNGAMLSYRLACEMSGVIAAAAPVEGAQNVDCQPKHPVSIIVFHGTADHLVPYDGGTTPFQVGPKRSDASVADTISFWVHEDGCAASPERRNSAGVHIAIYSGCRSGSGVALYAIQGGHHMWPGDPLSGNKVPATDLMWNFFSRHPKP